MAKATLKYSSGAVVTVEGTPEEVHRLINLHSGEVKTDAKSDGNDKKKIAEKRPPKADEKEEGDKPDLADIVNMVKNCDEAEELEKNILDRASQVDKTLLPLYVVHEYKGNKFGLTSGDISKITAELGVRIKIQNVSKTLSTTASRYVMGDKVRKMGHSVHYKLSRRGLLYMKEIISGKRDAK
jgi:hypothetical protein